MLVKVAIPKQIQFKIVPNLPEMLFGKQQEIHYIGGSEVLPPPLEAEEEALAIERLESGDEKEARAIIYASEHGKAYERANNEVRLNLNRCEICGDMVCEDCSVYSDELGGGVCCKKCAEANNEEKIAK